MTLYKIINEIPITALVFIVIALGANLIFHIHATITKVPDDFSNLHSFWPINHPVNVSGHEWDLCHVGLTKHFQSWFYPNYIVSNSDGAELGRVRLVYKRLKEYVDPEGQKIICPYPRTREERSISIFMYQGRVIAEADLMPIQTNELLELYADGRTIVARSIKLNSGNAYFENGKLLAEARPLSRYSAGPTVFCFNATLDPLLRKIIVLLETTQS